MKLHEYASPEAFKQAVEQRLRAAVQSAAPRFARKRQRLVYERMLARLVAVYGPAAVLKGGLALELRLGRARSTNDVDLRIAGSPHDVLLRLQEAGRRDLGDFMSFEVVPDDDHPEIRTDGMQYQGFRFRAECRLAGKLYGQRFGIDVAFGDPMLGEPDQVTASDDLGFAGIAPPTLRLYPIETHIAEKLHAYTLPRLRPNSRVKDLPDLALLASAGPLEAKRLTAAFAQTFRFRNTHAVPTSFPDPLAVWLAPYAAMARDDGLAWATLEAVTTAVRRFLDPVLAADLDAIWDPARWAWRERSADPGG